ncbi:MAG: hypothetical protein PHW73_01880 [Atribacterota bacterium]|nr:hypothetical protein [Atribacterota bacterium]
MIYENILDSSIYKMRTIPLEGIFRDRRRRLKRCSNCGNYGKPRNGYCIPVGRIINPDCSYCSWWRNKNNKVGQLQLS